MPLLAWVALGAVALLTALLLAAALWFDGLFEAPGAAYVPSLVEHLGARSVLAIFAHPDDETLVAGALADAARREGVVVRTITLTRGELGYAQPPICRPSDLPLVREGELRRYGFALGIEHQELWDYPDGQLDSVPPGPIIARLAGRIREWKPDLVITFDPAGGYTGHPDHRATGRLTSEAVSTARGAEHGPEQGAPHATKHLAYVVVPARAIRALGPREWQAVADVQPAPNLAVPSSKSLRLLGWSAHASQHLEQASPLPGWLLFSFWDKEHYVALGPGSLGPE